MHSSLRARRHITPVLSILGGRETERRRKDALDWLPGPPPPSPPCRYHIPLRPSRAPSSLCFVSAPHSNGRPAFVPPLSHISHPIRQGDFQSPFYRTAAKDSLSSQLTVQPDPVLSLFSVFPTFPSIRPASSHNLPPPSPASQPVNLTSTLTVQDVSRL
ncbi:hypothetical protein BC939DRAFT_61700 [Gamsiella multidivaricata]|uniref:uncharacterized protein n=1 Tax=Gamsiella multidivaricata TaxID=101098 RepID=UPI0022206FAD|nr:uncharacterized protein BC939DRAFT_61700 [Gamsiella multidivaricata]KAI7828619.1 hypothetical protein BC939DRAFT_61700 [Gamsiella multidivaricata]